MRDSGSFLQYFAARIQGVARTRTSRICQFKSFTKIVKDVGAALDSPVSVSLPTGEESLRCGTCHLFRQSIDLQRNGSSLNGRRNPDGIVNLIFAEATFYDDLFV